MPKPENDVIGSSIAHKFNVKWNTSRARTLTTLGVLGVVLAAGLLLNPMTGPFIAAVVFCAMTAALGTRLFMSGLRKLSSTNANLKAAGRAQMLGGAMMIVPAALPFIGLGAILIGACAFLAGGLHMLTTQRIAGAYKMSYQREIALKESTPIDDSNKRNGASINAAQAQKTTSFASHEGHHESGPALPFGHGSHGRPGVADDCNHLNQ